MHFRSHQAISTLIKERLSELEQRREEVNLGIAYWYNRATPDTEDGREAYKELSRLKNRLRSTNAALRKWTAIYQEFKADMGQALDDANSEARLAPLVTRIAEQVRNFIDKVK
jgi:inhibitor of KinA sporulation pathway (predicted exonuclease)